MASKLRAEIRQERSFRSSEQEAFLNLQRTADVLIRLDDPRHPALSFPTR